MSKMHYFSNKFSKIAKRWGRNIGDLKFRDLTKWWFFKPIMTKSTLTKQL